jgi:hypothetical protein
MDRFLSERSGLQCDQIAAAGCGINRSVRPQRKSLGACDARLSLPVCDYARCQIESPYSIGDTAAAACCCGVGEIVQDNKAGRASVGRKELPTIDNIRAVLRVEHVEHAAAGNHICG